MSGSTNRDSLALRSLADLPDDEAAAHVALLALRTGLPLGMGPHDDFLVPPDRRLFSAAQSVERLHALPKPVACGAEPRGDVLVLHCEVLASDDPAPRVNWAGSMDAMHQELNVRRVLFVGIDQALLTTVAAALRLHADYYLSVSSAGDAPDTEWGEHQGVVALGARAGADFVHLFFETDLNPEYRPPRR